MRIRPLDVLIAEDDAIVSAGIEAALRNAGFSMLRTVRTLAEGLTEARRQIPICAIIDGNLADGSNGLDLVAHLAGLGTPCLVISGHLMREDAMTAGARTFLPKPFTATQLLDHVDGLLVPRAGLSATGITE